MTLTANELSFSYRKDRPILQSISFSLHAGERLAVLGANGSGKTTLLKCLLGFIQPNGGRCLLDGTDIRTLPSKRFHQCVAYVPQSRGSFLGCTAREMILLGRTARISAFAMPSKTDHRKVSEVCERLGITHLLDKTGNEMSGGEWQMVLIARALAAEPRFLILDEPESNLDFRNQLIILDTLSALAKEGIGCLFNTHYPDHALSHADKALLLTRGAPALFSDVSSVITEKNIETAFGVRAAVIETDTPLGKRKNILPLSVL